MMTDVDMLVLLYRARFMEILRMWIQKSHYNQAYGHPSKGQSVIYN